MPILSNTCSNSDHRLGRPPGTSDFIILVKHRKPEHLALVRLSGCSVVKQQGSAYQPRLNLEPHRVTMPVTDGVSTVTLTYACPSAYPAQPSTLTVSWL